MTAEPCATKPLARLWVGPARWVLLAIALLVAAYGVLELAGARAYPSALSGPASDEAILLGGAYTLAWFGVVVVAPVLGLSLVIDRLLGVVCGRIQLAWTRSHRR